MKWEFAARDVYDAAGAIQNWIACGILPKDCSYRISENPERAGYYYAEVVK